MIEFVDKTNLILIYCMEIFLPIFLPVIRFVCPKFSIPDTSDVSTL